MKKEITYSPHIQKEIERAIIFMIQKIQERCYNEKPLILHSIKVGLRLLEQNKEKEVVIAGFLHDLIEDTDCKIKEIKEEFGVCDECGDYTDELALVEGAWICRACSHMP